ncbi:uroporphyrinogen-III synthase [Tsuneonella sp. HG222]
MTLPVIAIRPQPGCRQTAAAAAELGLAVACHPLFAIGAVAWTIPEGPFDGLLVGSANAMRHGGAGLDRLTGLPVHAVGEATAAAARERGFATPTIGSGGLQGVLDALAGQRMRLLRLAGEERVPLAPPAGIAITEVVVYRSEALAIDGNLDAILRSGAVILLHSAAAATHFASECDRLTIPRRAIGLATLGPRISDAAGQGWGAVATSAEPSDAALLALARKLCHDPFPG